MTDPFRPATNFQDFFSPVSFRDSLIFKTGSQRSERPVFLNKISPCRQSCPIGIDIPAAFHQASKGKLDEALRIYLQENPLPGICGRVCYHPCEMDCNRKDFDYPVNIRSFERFLSDHARVDVREEISTDAKKKRIAVIGSGPAGLSASYHLARLGYSVSLFEARHEIGGMLRYGIPSYRLPRAILDREIERILSLGIETHLDTDVGKILNWSEFESFDAVFISPGFQLGKMLFKKEASKNLILTGLDFLANPRKFGFGKGKVLIVGGGNVAIDVARTVIRLRRGRGKEITLICPESREQMPALPEEIKEALEEGITIINEWAPRKIHQKEGTKLTVEFSRVEVERDEATGKVRIIPVGKETQEYPADKIVMAIGQAAIPLQLSEKISIKENGIVTDRFGRTSLPKIFAGGDIRGGKAFVADAIASGKMGAMAISCFLEGKDAEAEFQRCQFGDRSSFSFQRFVDSHQKSSVDFKKVVSFNQMNSLFFYESSRNSPDQLEAAERIRTFEEVNSGFASGRVEDEISRCFRCGTCIDCENCLDFCPDLSILKDAKLGLYDFDEDHCKGCGVCSVACPRNVVEMVVEKNENVLDR